MPVILILKPSAGGEFHDLKRNRIQAGMDVIRNPELTGQLGILGIAGGNSVNPYIESGLYAVEAQIRIPAFKMFRN